MSSELLNLPWQLQLTLAGGYVAYVLAYVGIRDHHKPTEIIFLTIIFGSIVTGVAKVLLKFTSIGEIAAFVIAVPVAIVSGLLWRSWGRKTFQRALGKANIFADDNPSAWKAFFADTDHDITQVAVRLDDGTWLECEDASKFKDAPFGPCIFGASGDITLYVTKSTSADGEVKQNEAIRDPHYGDRIVYVPANRIMEINLRYKKKKLSRA